MKDRSDDPSYHERTLPILNRGDHLLGSVKCISQLHRLEPLNLTLMVTSVNGAKCSSVVRAFAHGAMGRRIDPS